MLFKRQLSKSEIEKCQAAAIKAVDPIIIVKNLAVHDYSKNFYFVKHGDETAAGGAI